MSRYCSVVVVASALLCLLLLCDAALGSNVSLPRAEVKLELNQRQRRKLAGDAAEFPDTPLYPGYGTHFAYLYVGTPPQRVSVIIDTGSHYTAFPCVGCANCGAHTDPYFDPDRSSTATISACNQGKCIFRQSYSEGSSWVAYKVVDKLWVGAELLSGLEMSEFAVDFMFGCQTSETGLFRTQLADGIMGMSAQSTTLVPQLFSQGVVKRNIFALCFKDGGGAMTLGGVDTSSHLGPVQYLPMLKPTGWFTIKLLDILVGGKSIEMPPAKYNSGKGVIVDSGTTDTYLPTSIRQAFVNTMQRVAGVTYSTGKLAFTQQEFDNLPTLTFVFENGVLIEMPPTSYMDRVGKDRYMFRVYLTEGAGAVLGANFMKNFDVIFDIEQQRVGFAPADCEYVYHAPPAPPQSEPEPVEAPAPAPGLSPTMGLSPTLNALPNGCIYSELIPISGCNATCSPLTTGASSGLQRWGRSLAQRSDAACSTTIVESFRDCYVTCSKGAPVHGVPSCSVSPWSKCDSACTQVREIRTLVSSPSGSICRSSAESRMCNVGLCPSGVGDYFVVLDMKVTGVSASEWMGGAIKDDYRTAIASVLNVSEGTVEIMTSPDAPNDNAPVSHLQFQIRIARTGGDDGAARAYQIAAKLQEGAYATEFPRAFVSALNKVGVTWESIEASADVRTLSSPPATSNLSARYGWLQPNDVVVSHVSAVPISHGQDPIETSLFLPEAHQVHDSPTSAISAVITSVAVVSCVVAIIAMYLNHRLRLPRTPKLAGDPKRTVNHKRARFVRDDWERRRLLKHDAEDEEIESQL